jgi:hypothetical protein
MPFVDDTLVTLIKAAPALTTIIGTNPTKFYPDTIGSATRPAVAYQRIDDNRQKSLKGDSNLARARFQLTVFAVTSQQRQTLIAALRATLEGYSDRATGGLIDSILYDDARNQYDPATKDYLSFVDFIIWHKEL